MLIATFLMTGCEGKGALNLPEEEMKQLNSAGNDTFHQAKKAFGNTGSADSPSVRKFYVYADNGYFKNHFVPSGWMGDYGDLKMNENWKDHPYSRRSCIRIDYSASKKQGAGWAGVYWQDPVNNWGNLSGGYDLTGAKELTFYARGEKGGEIIAEFKIGGLQGVFSDTTSVSIGPIFLTVEWKKYTINLKGEDLSHIIGGFAFVMSEMENPGGATFYLDDIA